MTEGTRRRRFDGTGIGFLLTYAIPGLLVLSAWLGRTTGHPDAFAFLPLIVAFAVVPLTSVIRPGRDDEAAAPRGAAAAPGRGF